MTQKEVHQPDIIVIELAERRRVTGSHREDAAPFALLGCVATHRWCQATFATTPRRCRRSCLQHGRLGGRGDTGRPTLLARQAKGVRRHVGWPRKRLGQQVTAAPSLTSRGVEVLARAIA